MPLIIDESKTAFFIFFIYCASIFVLSFFVKNICLLIRNSSQNDVYIIKYFISDSVFFWEELKNKINKLTDKEIMNLYNTILSFNILENQKGNEYDQAFIEYTYIEQTKIIEHINIFKIVRVPSKYDFIKYFLSIEEKYQLQAETKAYLNDYITNIEEISQNIQIKMVFNIETNDDVSKKIDI